MPMFENEPSPESTFLSAMTLMDEDGGADNGDDDVPNSETDDDQDAADAEADPGDSEEANDDDGEEGDDTEEEDDDDEVEEDEEDEEGEAPAGKYDADYTYFDDDEGKEVFLRAEDPETGEKSVYLSRDEAKKGLERQLQFIGQLKAEVDTVKETSTRELQARDAELAIFRRTLTKESAQEMLIRSRMPEEFQTVDPSKLDVSDRDRYTEARVEARLRLEAEIRDAQEKEKLGKDAKLAAAQAAADHVKARVSDFDFLGIANAEDRMAFRTLLKKEENGKTVRQMADLIAEEFGTEHADRFLLGHASDFRKASSAKKTEAATKAGKGVKTKKKVASGAASETTRRRRRADNVEPDARGTLVSAIATAAKAR